MKLQYPKHRDLRHLMFDMDGDTNRGVTRKEYLVLKHKRSFWNVTPKF